METIYEQEFGPIRRGVVYRTTRSAMTDNRFLVIDCESMDERVLGVDMMHGLVPDIVVKSCARTELMEPMGEALPIWPWVFACRYRDDAVQFVADAMASLPAVRGDSNIARLEPLNDQINGARYNIFRHDLDIGDAEGRIAAVAHRMSHDMARVMRESWEQQITERMLASVKARGWIK